MANVTTRPLDAMGTDYVVITGKIEGGATSAFTKVTGAGYTVATGAGSGVYTITLDDTWNSVVSFVGTFGADTVANVDTYSCVQDDDGSSASSIVLTTSEGGTPTDLAANEFLNFVCFVRRGSVTT